MENSMAFTGPTLEKKISTVGKTYKMFLTEQVGGYWVATVLYAKDGVISTKNEIGSSKDDAYQKGFNWALNNIDQEACIEPL